ncbi:unnamed protein product [Staurois parvus]|uniref:Uncharacterized protein n=1 Tax=Staurois parvus TaxID=386267 RepID=A0ABN9E7Y9_9NEOB|nr:unnamed protein product [Staurois parvus]
MLVIVLSLLLSCHADSSLSSASCWCSSVPCASATYQCLPVHINATYQCPSELPFSVTHQCHLSMLPVSAAYQCCLSVSISDACQCPSLQPH